MERLYKNLIIFEKLLLIKKDNNDNLYRYCPFYEVFGLDYYIFYFVIGNFSTGSSIDKIMINPIIAAIPK